MSELVPTTPIEINEHEMSGEDLSEAIQDLGSEAVEQSVKMNATETSDKNNSEKISSSDTASMIDAYKAEHGSVYRLSMKELVEKGFDPDMTLAKIGNERLEHALETVNVRYRAKRDTAEWRKMEEVEARNISISDAEIDALLEAGVNPQGIVDALQRTEPKDGVDNPSSARIVARLDKLVDAGLSPAILAARLNPNWRESVKDRLDESQIRWHEANRLKAVA